MFYGTLAPEGYFAMDGSPFDTAAYQKLAAVLGNGTLPNVRGLFVRGYDPVGNADPSGASRGLGSRQEDAIRNITGSLTAVPSGGYSSGAITNTYIGTLPGFDGRIGGWRLDFDASRVVPTADENRPKNMNLLYCIKHD